MGNTDGGKRFRFGGEWDDHHDLITQIREMDPAEARRRLAGESRITFDEGDADEQDAGPPPDEVWRYLDKNAADVPTRKEFSHHIKSHQQLRQRLSTSQDEATIAINPKGRYFGIVLSSDWHFGSLATDYDALDAHLDFLIESPDLFLVTVGDLIDNFRKFRNVSAIFSQAIAPEVQMQWLLSVIKELGQARKWLAACWGNHDCEWDEKNHGQSPVGDLLGSEFVYFPAKGELRFSVGEGLTYRVVLSHYFKGYSMYNPTHSLLRAVREQFPGVDVICQGHLHNFAYQWLQPFPKMPPVHYVQLGAFKQGDLYSRRFFKPGQIGVPTLVFDSETHRTLFFQTPADAVQFMQV